MTSPPPPPPAATRAPTRSSARWLYVLGVLLILLGVGLTVPMVLDRGICMFVPCDPAVGSVGFTRNQDGTVGVELGDTTAEQAEVVEVVAGDSPDRQDRQVLWRIERGEPGTDRIERPIVPGVAPPGFVETVPLQVPLPARYSVEVTNGCFGGLEELPDTPLEPGVVTYTSGVTESLERFRSDDLGFSDCESDAAAANRRRAMVGLVCGFVGALIVLLGGRVGAARSPDSSAGAQARRSGPGA